MGAGLSGGCPRAGIAGEGRSSLSRNCPLPSMSDVPCGSMCRVQNGRELPL